MALSADMKVEPSGLAVATAWPPMLVEAPGRLSTMICWPSVWRMASATVRASTSVPPPAGYGTTQRRGLPGQGPRGGGGGACGGQGGQEGSTLHGVVSYMKLLN